MPRVPGSISFLAIVYQGLAYLYLGTPVKPIGEQTTEIFLEDLLAEGRQAQLDRQGGRAVVLVDDRVDLDDLKAGHASVVGDDLHGQVGFAVAGAAAHRGAHAGSVFRIDPVHVERDVVAGGAASGHAQGFFDDRAHAALVDIAHGIDLDPGLFDVLLLAGIDIAYAHQDTVFRLHFGREVVDVGEFRRAQAQDRRQRHAVDIPARRGLRRVDVRVRVNPDQPHFLLLSPVKFRYTSHGSGSHGMVSAENQRHFPGLE